MVRLIIWAMATGFITGAVWFAIHFLRRGGSVPLALRGDRNHDALAPGGPSDVNGYQPIAQELHPHLLAERAERVNVEANRSRVSDARVDDDRGESRDSTY